MPIGTTLAKVSWKQLIVLVPDVAKAAKAIWNQWESKPKPEPVNPDASLNAQVLAVSRRLEAMDNNEVSQSKWSARWQNSCWASQTGLKKQQPDRH